MAGHCSPDLRIATDHSQEDVGCTGGGGFTMYRVLLFLDRFVSRVASHDRCFLQSLLSENSTLRLRDGRFQGAPAGSTLAASTF